MDATGLARLFPSGVVVCVAEPAMYRAELFPEEAAAVIGAVTKRREDFAAGRAAARRALAALGIPAAPLPRCERRSPVWPKGFVGSITHCAGFCAAVAASDATALSLGLDAEANTPLDRELEAMICSPAEMLSFARLPSPAAGDWLKLAFSAKEAYYKCVDPILREFLDFRDVEVGFRVGPSRDRGIFEVAPLRPSEAPVVGSWAVDDERVYAGACWPRG